MKTVEQADNLESRAPGRAPAADGAGDAIIFATHPDHYRHWRLSFNEQVATLALDVDEPGGLRPGYELKLNTYDLGVDIELHDAVQRLRFEHPEVRVVVLTSAKDRIFCAGANIQMLAQSAHDFKVNFCKFTNETRNGIEDSSQRSGQYYICALNGPAAGGGYELALACDHILLVDDGATAVSLPEVALLAVLPGTGGLTRLVEKRKVRRDIADVVATRAEGTRGVRALDWGLVDELAERSAFEATVAARAEALARSSSRPAGVLGISLPVLRCEQHGEVLKHRYVSAAIDREAGTVAITVSGPDRDEVADLAGIHARGAEFWALRAFLELDDIMLWLRFNAASCGTWLIRTSGDISAVVRTDELLAASRDDWLVNEIIGLIRRVLRRLETSARSIFAIVEPGSCYAGSLLELALAADRSYMLDSLAGDGVAPAPPVLVLTTMNFESLEMDSGLTRLETRFLGAPDHVAALRELIGTSFDAQTASELGLVTFVFDEIDWEDEIRLAVEERASFSPDALTGMEANLRFAGPETCATKIFGRLSSWQNWIFQRPNASGSDGALRRYGSGSAPVFDSVRT
ncbi:MAG: 2,3-epoxybenzoyl-CoA dihydrolase [Acidimicrobiales bacterium]